MQAHPSITHRHATKGLTVLVCTSVGWSNFSKCVFGYSPPANPSAMGGVNTALLKHASRFGVITPAQMWNYFILSQPSPTACNQDIILWFVQLNFFTSGEFHRFPSWDVLLRLCRLDEIGADPLVGFRSGLPKIGTNFKSLLRQILYCFCRRAVMWFSTSYLSMAFWANLHRHRNIWRFRGYGL